MLGCGQTSIFLLWHAAEGFKISLLLCEKFLVRYKHQSQADMFDTAAYYKVSKTTVLTSLRKNPSARCTHRPEGGEFVDAYSTNAISVDWSPANHKEPPYFENLVRLLGSLSCSWHMFERSKIKKFIKETQQQQQRLKTKKNYLNHFIEII